MSLYAVKTTANQEETVASMVGNRGKDEIHGAVASEDMVSYIIVEASSKGVLERVLEEIPHSRGIVRGGEVSISEIEHFFQPSSDVKNISESDLVEITDGPYSGEKAVVKRIDESNEQITVELAEATVPIPVTMRGDQVRVLDSEDRNP